MEQEYPGGKWLIAYSSLQPGDAYIVKGFLESHGIVTFVKDEIINQLQEFSYATGGIKIMVNEKDYEKSVSLLTEGGFILSADEPAEKEVQVLKADDRTDRFICPFCSSDNISRKKETRFWALLVAFVGAGGPDLSSPYNICFSCGRKWRWGN